MAYPYLNGQNTTTNNRSREQILPSGGRRLKTRLVGTSQRERAGVSWILRGNVQLLPLGLACTSAAPCPMRWLHRPSPDRTAANRTKPDKSKHHRFTDSARAYNWSKKNAVTVLRHGVSICLFDSEDSNLEDWA